MLRVVAGAASDMGRRHEVNEDRVLAGRAVFAVADGMGGHAAGEVASALAVARLGRLDEEAVLTPDVFRAHLAAANADILASGARDPGRRGMGATVAGIGVARVAGSEHWVVFNIGDCRVYRMAKGRLTQLTVDHNEAAENAAGVGGTESAAHGRHPGKTEGAPVGGAGGRGTASAAGTAGIAMPRRRNVVTRSLGSEPAPEPDIRVLPPVAGERFLICSDGLCLEVGDAAIAEVLRTEPDPTAAARALVRAAIAAGGRDDVSAVVVDHRAAVQTPSGDDTQPRQFRMEVAR